MQGTESPRFVPRVWPAEPPGTPEVACYELVPDENPGALTVLRFAGNATLPADFVLRELLEMQITSAVDVVDLARTWGMLTDTDDRAFEYIPRTSNSVDIEQEIAAWDGLVLVHPDAFLLHLLALQALGRHALAHLEGAGDAAIVAAWEHVANPTTAGQAWHLWASYMNRGLAAFTVHVRVREGDDEGWSRPRPNLYNACCLQLAQYVASEVSVKRCANDRCKKPFTTQRGRAEYGQHRSSGVRYCSHLCAKAQSAREQRARRRQEKERGR